jgi:hypothetical protein
MSEVITELELPIQGYSHVSSANCINVNNAFDDNPATAATFEGPYKPPQVYVPGTGGYTNNTLLGNTLSNALAAAFIFNEGGGTTTQDAAHGENGTLASQVSWAIGDAGNCVQAGVSTPGITANDTYLPASGAFEIVIRFQATGTDWSLFAYAGLNIYIAGSGYLYASFGSTTLIGTYVVNDGNWYTVNVSYDGSGDWVFYVNGTQQNTYSGDVLALTKTGTYNVIPSRVGYSGMLNVDLLYYFNRQLTITERALIISNPYGSVYVFNVGSETRYIYIAFETNLWLTKLRYLGDGSNVGIVYDSGFSYDSGIIPPAQVPLNCFLPLNVGGNVYDLHFANPVLARGIWIFPDYLSLNPEVLPNVDLYQLQIYYSFEETINMAANPTKTAVILGLRTLGISQWYPSSTYPFSSATINLPLSLQSLDLSSSSKVAEELGGEDIYLNGIYEYERRITGKFAVSRTNLQLFFNLLNGNLIVDNAGTANEAQYLSPQFTDVNPYFTLTATSTEGDGARIVVLPKAKISSGLSETWDRTKLTVFDVTFEAVWDPTYICTTGVIGGIRETIWNANSSLTPVRS